MSGQKNHENQSKIDEFRQGFKEGYREGFLLGFCEARRQEDAEKVQESDSIEYGIGTEKTLARGHSLMREITEILRMNRILMGNLPDLSKDLSDGKPYV